MSTDDILQLLDPLDLRIILLLDHDPRATYQEISDQAGCSRATIRTRVHKLLDAGVMAFTARPHPRVGGWRIPAELLVDTGLSDSDVAAALHGRSHLHTGYADELVAVSAWCRDDEDLITLADRLRALPEVYSVEVFRPVRILRDRLPAPAHSDFALEETDHRVMDLLTQDPRASYSWLSTQIGLCPSALRQRVIKLRDAGAIHLGTTVRLPDLYVTAFRAAMTSYVPAAFIARTLLRLPGLTYLAIGYGRHHILADLATSPSEQHALYQQIRAIPGISDLRLRHRTPTPHDSLALLRPAPTDTSTTDPDFTSRPVSAPGSR